jgi:hypothetical protein
MHLTYKIFILLLLLFPISQVFAEEYSGAINETLPIHMTLIFHGPDVTGHYAYIRKGMNGSELALKGQRKEKAIELNEFDPSGKQTGTFRGTVREDLLIQGDWTASDGKKNLKFRLLRQRPEDPVSGQYEMIKDRKSYEGTLNLLLM